MTDILARVSGFSAALIMRTETEEIEIFVSSRSHGNPYQQGERAKLNTGLYCETVMKTRMPLYVPNALKDPAWRNNPDIHLGMICYFGIPLCWPDGSLFGTICALDSQEKVLARDSEELMVLMREVIEADLERLARSSEEAKQSTATLHEAEGRYSAIFHQAAIGIACVGLDGRWLEVNDRLCEITGYSREEMKERTFQAITHDEDLQKDLNLADRLLSGDIPTYTMEKRYWHKQGHVVWILLTGSLVRDSDEQPSYYVAVVEDITEKKFLQHEVEQAQKLEAMGRLVGGIAHEFNNKLSAITGNLFLATRRPETYQAYVKDAEKLCFQASEMIDSLLAYARKGPTEKGVVSLRPFLKEVFKSFQVVVPENIDMKVELGSNNLMQVRGNATQLQQIVVNLINNAIYAVQTVKNPRVSVKLTSCNADAKFMMRHSMITAKRLTRIVVEDNGVGMTSAQLGKIFDPFYTTKPVGKGTGLGLAIVASLVEQHGGAIDVESSPGCGTRFEVYFPLVEQPEARDARAADGQHIATGKGQTILVVDDNESVLHITGEVLETLGYDVLVAREGREALKVFEANKQISCVLTDVVMPVMGGVELFRRLKAIDTAAKVLFMTGHDAGDDVASVDVPVLLKPIAVADLSAALQQMFEG